MDDAERARTLEAYRRAKWAELHDEGPDRLRMELARLETWLARVAAGDTDWWGAREMEVDVAFREAKVRVLREVLEQAGAQEGL